MSVLAKQVEPLKYWIQSVIPQVYDDSMSLYELVGKITAKLNEVIDQSNLYFKEDITVHVEKILKEYVDDGTFDKIINHNLFNDFETRFDTIEDRFLVTEENIIELFNVSSIWIRCFIYERCRL